MKTDSCKCCNASKLALIVLLLKGERTSRRKNHLPLQRLLCLWIAIAISEEITKIILCVCVHVHFSSLAVCLHLICLSNPSHLMLRTQQKLDFYYTSV